MKLRSSCSYFIALSFMLVSPVVFCQQVKYALVIGAQNYSSFPPLRNSLEDARDLSASLRSKGFKVEMLLDPHSNQEIKDAILRYITVMRDVVGGVGVIFYAGHGQQYEGNNYLIPTHAKEFQVPSDLKEQCVNMNMVMDALNLSNRSLNILFMDACRTLPGFTRDSGQGWSKMEAPRGSIIVFATEAGKVASDGIEKNGLFTSKLLARMDEPGLNIAEVIKRVKLDVFRESGEKQLPTLEDNSIGGDFYFTPATNASGSSRVAEVSAEGPEPVRPAEALRTSKLDFGYGVLNAPVIRVGNQEWMGRNLNVDRFANGDPIPEARTAEEWVRAFSYSQPAWCYYDNDPANGTTYGKLYNSYALTDPRGLAPKGWHIPKVGEWNALFQTISNDGRSLKSTSGWLENGNGTNITGFAGSPGGYRSEDGSFSFIRKGGYWWSDDSGWYTRLIYSSGSVTKVWASPGKGFSVRCVRD